MKYLLTLSAMLVSAALAGAPAKQPVQESDPEVIVSKSKKKVTRDYRNVFPVKTIAITTPASYPHSGANRLGVEMLKKGNYKVKVMPHTFLDPATLKNTNRKAAKGYASIPVEMRLEDFYKAWNDPEVEMIICSRGGNGCFELLEKIDWNKLKKRPEMIFMGYSDVTLILCKLLEKEGYARPVAGPMMGSMTGLPPAMITGLKKMLSGEKVGPYKVTPLVGGDCSGKAVAGLLQRFATAKRANYAIPTKGKIIFIEGVSLSAARVKQELLDLKKMKFFDGAAGVVFCHFTRTKEGREIGKVIKEFAPTLGIPVYTGFPFGHAAKNQAIDLTRTAVIKNNTVTFPAVKK